MSRIKRLLFPRGNRISPIAYRRNPSRLDALALGLRYGLWHAPSEIFSGANLRLTVLWIVTFFVLPISLAISVIYCLFTVVMGFCGFVCLTEEAK